MEHTILSLRNRSVPAFTGHFQHHGNPYTTRQNIGGFETVSPGPEAKDGAQDLDKKLIP